MNNNLDRSITMLTWIFPVLGILAFIFLYPSLSAKERDGIIPHIFGSILVYSVVGFAIVGIVNQ